MNKYTYNFIPNLTTLLSGMKASVVLFLPSPTIVKEIKGNKRINCQFYCTNIVERE